MTKHSHGSQCARAAPAGMGPKHRLTSTVSFVAVLMGAGHASALPTLSRSPESEPLAITLGRNKLQGYLVVGGKPMELHADGPGDVQFRVMRRLGDKQPSSVGAGTLTVHLDGQEVASHQVKPRMGEGRLSDDSSKLGRALPVVVPIPDGAHQLTLAVESGDSHGAVVVFKHKPSVGEPAAAPSAAAQPPSGEDPPAEPGAPASGNEIALAPPPEPAGSESASTSGDAVDSADSSSDTPLEKIAAQPASTATSVEPEPVDGEQRLPADEPEPLGVAASLRLGIYHGSGSNDLGASFALGADVRGRLPVVPRGLGNLWVAVSGGWLSFSRTKALTDDELGAFDTQFALDFIPLTIEAIFELPEVGPVFLYGGVAGALYIALAESKAFGDKDKRSTALPAFQAFGAVGVAIDRFTVGFELRYTNVQIDFETGTKGSGAGLFGQAVAGIKLL